MPQTVDNGRRKGDERPKQHAHGVPLNLHPDHDEPFRWLPRHGEPSCIGEWLTQKTLKGLSWFPIYATIWMILATVAYFMSR